MEISRDLMQLGQHAKEEVDKKMNLYFQLEFRMCSLSFFINCAIP